MADIDGVIVVPKARIEVVLEEAKKVAEDDVWVLGQIKSGRTLAEIERKTRSLTLFLTEMKWLADAPFIWVSTERSLSALLLFLAGPLSRSRRHPLSCTCSW